VAVRWTRVAAATVPAEAPGPGPPGNMTRCGECGCRTTSEGIPNNGEHGRGARNRHDGAPRGERLPTVGNAWRPIKRAPPCRSWHGVTGGTQPPGRLRRSVAPHFFGWQTEKKKERRRSEKNENQKEIVARMSEATCGDPRRGPDIAEPVIGPRFARFDTVNQKKGAGRCRVCRRQAVVRLFRRNFK
jgi:hypothetical protein